MKLYRSLFAIGTLLALAVTSEAHFVWATVQPNRQIRLELADVPGEPEVPILAQRLSSLIPHAVGTPHLGADHKSVIAPLLAGRNAGGVDMLYGVFQSFLVHWYAKGSQDLASAQEKLGLKGEILTRKTSSGWAIQVVDNGKLIKNAAVEMYVPGSSSPIVAHASEAGLIRLPSMQPGTLYIGAEIRHPGGGTYNAERYSDSLDMVSLSVKIG